MANKNVMLAIDEFDGYLKELSYCNPQRKQWIRKQAVTCGDLMIYSDLVADTRSKEWKQLDRLVADVMESTN